MKQILFDSDLLGDDLLALYAMCESDHQIVGVTSFGRRTTALQRCRIAQVFLESHHVNGIPLVPGCDRPLLQEPLVGCTFCDDAMSELKDAWDAGTVYANPILDSIHAAQYMIDCSKKYHGLSLLCTGPLTNVALAMELDPGFPERLSEIVIMGGVVSVRGNSSPVAEANFYNDPEAAQIVFSRCRNAVVVPLDVTLQVPIDDHIAEFCTDPFLKKVCKACCYAHVCKGGNSIMPLHDLLTYFVLDDRSYVTLKPMHIDIETSFGPARAMMVTNKTDCAALHLVATEVDVERVIDEFKCLFVEGKS